MEFINIQKYINQNNRIVQRMSDCLNFLIVLQSVYLTVSRKAVALIKKLFLFS